MSDDPNRSSSVEHGILSKNVQSPPPTVDESLKEKPIMDKDKYLFFPLRGMLERLPPTVSEYLLQQDDESEMQELKPFSYFDLLDKPRKLPEPVKMEMEHLKCVEYDLALIRLCWPEVPCVDEEGEAYPTSYSENNSKERVLLLYAENFRRQYCRKFSNRKPLLLACDNECNMKKMVCTTIRPTKLPYSEVATWKDCANFIANHLEYVPLDSPTYLPTHLRSPNTVVKYQKGHCFELATVLCSLLIGLGYDAYVVSGYANKDITMKIMKRVDTPYPPEPEEEEVVEEPPKERKYKLKELRDLRSKFHLMMEQRELDKIEAEQKQMEAEEVERIKETEKLPPDELENDRVHSWVLIRKGQKDIVESIFVEPSSGYSFPLDSPSFKAIESVWNHLNYWVNMQHPNKKVMDDDLANIEKWEHLLIGEPSSSRIMKQKEGMEEENRDMYDEKHLDIPKSWSLKIHIPHSAFHLKFPNGKRQTFYKRTFVEEFAPFVQENGISARIERYSDFDCTDKMVIEEQFINRKDKCRKKIRQVHTNTETEYFLNGRPDCVKKHTYIPSEYTFEITRTIEFFHQARFDCLKKVMILFNPPIMKIEYFGREDKLLRESVIYSSTEIVTSVETRREIHKIIQHYARNEAIPAWENIAVREFSVHDHEISLKFHYGRDKITASTRNFKMPPMAEFGESLTFYPELTSGFDSEFDIKPMKQHKIFLLLQENIESQDVIIQHVRDIEKQVASFLQLRLEETLHPELYVSIFNQEHNEHFKIGMLEREKEIKEHKEKEIKEETDYLAPYLVRVLDPDNITQEEALEIRNACLTDFKQLLVNRANDTLRLFDKACDVLSSRQDWVKKNQYNLDAAEEFSIMEELKNLRFYYHTLEIRLTRHRDLSQYRYNSLVNYLNKHPKLIIFNLPPPEQFFQDNKIQLLK